MRIIHSQHDYPIRSVCEILDIVELIELTIYFATTKYIIKERGNLRIQDIYYIH